MAKTHNQTKPNYKLDKKGIFVIENYNHSKPFSNFFPGIAGKYGIPMWVFYVNRGQAITSFGVKDKDHPILEYFPANKSYFNTNSLGFRTFIKTDNKKTVLYEPFHNGLYNLNFDIINKMLISSYDLTLEEKNLSLGLETKVNYFTLPEESFAALVRKVTIKNLSNKTQKIELVDGLPQIAPFGMNNWVLKEMSRTIEAWMVIDNLDNSIPFFRLEVDPQDRPEVVHIDEGNFYLGFTNNNNNFKLIKPIVDPVSIFGQVSDFSYPAKFLSSKQFGYPKDQLTKSKTPCGFVFDKMSLAKGQEKTLYTLCGYMRSKNALTKVAKIITNPDYLKEKAQRNKEIIEELQSAVETKSSSCEFDNYTKQTFLDNVLRGGYPVTFKNNGKSAVFYLYSRKHGDLERDYNRFFLQPSYLSQGNGNYRDINQNRRLDNWFNSDVADSNVVHFLNLIQLDGFNPLVVKGINFVIEADVNIKAKLESLTNKENAETIINFVKKAFSPGDLIEFLDNHNIKLNCSYEEFLNEILPLSSVIHEAEHGEGFWIDHWTYNLDLIENYLAVYPEKEKELMFEKKEFTFFDNSEIITPRQEKYVLYNGLVRQLHAVKADHNKKEMIKKRLVNNHVVRTNYGQGEIYKTTLLNKLLCLALNKIASLDPKGVGIEMEANKPSWYDALNGLPALFGSSSCETFELKRLLLFIKNSFENHLDSSFYAPEEIADFMFSIDRLLESEYARGESKDKDQLYWDEATTLKESFRKKTIMGISGNKVEIKANDFLAFLERGIKKTNIALDKAYNKKTGLYYTYFINYADGYDQLSTTHIKIKNFNQVPLPYFLESQMHALRLIQDKNTAKKLYNTVLESELLDKKLKNYKVNAPLKDMPEEIGRCRVFTPGWLENESIWLHMEYKYLLEIIKQGLFEEFYADFKNVLIPFKNAQTYGRSILENSSFLVSSAFCDKNLWGTGFVARLSGSTIELLNIWLVMNIGNKPFYLDNDKKLNLKINPALPGWLFDKKIKSFQFNFLSEIKVTYYNQKLKNTYGQGAVKVKKISFLDKDSAQIEIKSDTIPSPYAEQIRSRQIKKINILLD